MNETTSDVNDTSAAAAPNGTANGATSEAPKEAPKESPVEAPKAGVSVASATGGEQAPPRIRHTLAGTKEASKAEMPKAEAPKVEGSKIEAPKERPPRTELRLRMKVWTSETGKRYLMPTAVMADPRLGMMNAYAMSDEDTKLVKLTPAEWNALPFFYFQEDGPAPRATARPVDVIPR